MKNVLLLVFVFVSCTNVNAQYISLDELINIRSKDLESSNNYLSNKGWEFSGSTEETYKDYSSTTWCYGRTSYTSRAKAFVTLFVADSYYSKVVYTTINKLSFDAIRNKIYAYKMIKISSTPKDGEITTSYMGDNYVVSMSISTDDFTYKPIYKVVVEKRGNIPKKPSNAYKSTSNYISEIDKDDNTDSNKKAKESSRPEPSDSDIVYFKALVTGKKYNQGPGGLSMYLYRAPSSLKLLIEPKSYAKTIMVIGRNDLLLIISELPYIDNIDDKYVLVYSNEFYGYIKYTDLNND